MKGTSISNATLAQPSQYNFAIQDGFWPGLIPYLNVSNIEGTQEAAFFIDFGASVSTSFAQNCTQTLNSSNPSCQAGPVFADPAFTS
jgi:hypothetical protein